MLAPWKKSYDQPSRIRLSGFAFTFHFHALEKETATHSSFLAWRIPGTGEPGGLPSVGSHRVRHDWSDLAATAASDSILKSRDISLLTKVHLIRAMVFPVVTYGCESWTIMKAVAAAAAAKLLQSCLTLCDPIDGSPSGSSIPGILLLYWLCQSFWLCGP